MQRFTHDIKSAWRGFRRTPAFPITVLVVLAISIGGAVAMSTVTRAVLLQQLPVVRPEQLAVLTSYDNPAVEMSPPQTMLRQLRDQLNTVTDIAGVAHWGVVRSPYLEGEQTRILNHSDVTSNYFTVLGAQPTIGRLFVEADDRIGASPTMVLSYGAWKTKFGGDSSVIGRQIVWPYTQMVYTIVGVAPAGLDYPLGVECWTPMAAGDPRQTLAVVRLKPGMDLEAAAAEYFREANRLLPSYGLKGASGKHFMDVVVGDARSSLSVLSAAVLLLLLIACVNIANLFLVRAGQRVRELALRRVLGASYLGIVRQLTVESVLLAAAGGVLGTAVAWAMIRAIVAIAPQQLPRLDLVRIDAGVYVIALAITSLSVLVFGLAPALIAAGASNETSIRSSSRSSTQTRFRTRLHDTLVASQVGLAVTLLVAAGLLSRSLIQLQQESLGYNADHLTIASFAWDATKTDTPAEILAMGQQLESRFRELPGVQSVSPIIIPPFYGTNVWHGAIESEPELANSTQPAMDVPIEIGGAGYFETMRTQLTHGRGFLDSDNAGSEKVVVVSASIAKHFWPLSSAVGKRVRFVQQGPKPDDWSRVIGVVPDTRFRSLRATSPMLYTTWLQLNPWQGTFAIRSSRPAARLAPDIRNAARTVNPTLVLGDFRTMDDALSTPLSTPRLMALLVSAFGGIAIFLAAVGLYGVLASTVRDRTREFGIRSALGAAPSRLVLSVMQHAMAVAGVGVMVGLVVAISVTRFLQSLLYQTSPTDLATLMSASAILLVVTIFAASAPALYVTRIQPMNALRAE